MNASIAKIALLSVVFFANMITVTITNPNFTNNTSGWNSHDCVLFQWTAGGDQDAGSARAIGTSDTPCRVSQAISPTAYSTYTLTAGINCPIGVQSDIVLGGLRQTCPGQGTWAPCSVSGVLASGTTGITVETPGDCYIDNVALAYDDQWLPHTEVNGYSSITVTLTSGRVGVIEYRITAGDIGVIVAIVALIFVLIVGGRR